MTRADEIADEFEGPVDGARRPRRDDPVSGPSRLHSETPTLPQRTATGAVTPAETGDELDTLESLASNGSAADHVEDDKQKERHLRLTLHPHVSTEDQALTAVVGDPPDTEPDEAPAASGSEPSDDIVESPRHESLPDLARHAAGAWLKAAGWTAGTSLRVGNELRRIATDPNGAQEVIEEVTKEVREVARDFLGITELESEVKEMAPLLSTGLLKTGVSSPEALRAQGEQLLREAADVGFDEGAHPAFARILTELSPDEARILRLLAIEGPEPMVDVRAHNLIGNGSQLIAQALNMLGPKAGLRRRERVPVYLTNLARLNLIVLSDEPLESPVQYQVLEAQPDVLAVMHDTVRARVIRRSVSLTPLGREFCDVCLPVNLPALPPPSQD